MIRWIKAWAVGLSASMLLVACSGGGGDAGDCLLCPPGGTDAQVADLVIVLSSQSITNSGSDTVTATVTALNDSRVAISGTTVSVSVDANAVASVDSTTTGTAGTVTATVGVGGDKSNRTITVTAISGTVTRQASFQVTGTHVTSTYASTVAPETGNTIRYLVADITDQPLAGVEISVSAPGLDTATGTTSAAGAFDYTYTAPATPGSLEVTATVAGVTDVATIQVQATAAVPPAVGPVSSASVSANPKTVSTNTVGSTANRSQIRALFVKADNSPIANVRVRFDLNGDLNNIGGTFSSGSDMLYSSALGTVTVSYIPGTRSSPTDGVTVRACWDYNDFVVGQCPNQATATLTVTAEAISVTLGTNREILSGEAGLTYIKQFVVMVVDSAGNAMPGVTISPVVDLTDYAKGGYVKGSDGWIWQPTVSCTNEDINRNGVLDSGEDINGSVSIEPRKADVSVRMVGSVTTDASGIAVLQIEYPENVASWDFFKLTVSASGVSGTEGSASMSGWLPVPADVISDTDATPAFVVSPYGTGLVCTDPN